VAEVPRRFVTDAKGSFDLVGRHSLARLAKQVDSGKPFDEWKVRIVENAACGHGKLVVAFLAVKDVGGVGKPNDWAVAA
jgi:hypothetical protein